MNNKYRIVILANELEDDEINWVEACKKKTDTLDYKLVSLIAANWLEQIISFQPDYLLAKPPGLTAPYKQLFDERMYILNQELKIPVYPNLTEILIYENKRFLSFWMKANEIPHPQTNVFYFKKEAFSFIKSAELPIVAKINIGASGKGVRILNSRDEALGYIESAFTAGGISSKVGPNMNKGNLLGRGFAYVKNPGGLKKLIKKYKSIANDKQRGFVIFQTFVPHKFEWRVVRIGDSFFAHKKIVKKGKASGSLLKGYENPPLSLFDFVKEVTDKHGLYSQAVDLFETSDGRYLVNEMQCIFGQSDPYQMLVDGKPGRYVYHNGNWVFEAGDFNTNKSYDLRLAYVLDQLSAGKSDS